MQKRELWLEYKIRKKKDHVAISIIICGYFSSKKTMYEFFSYIENIQMENTFKNISNVQM